MSKSQEKIIFNAEESTKSNQGYKVHILLLFAGEEIKLSFFSWEFQEGLETQM